MKKASLHILHSDLEKIISQVFIRRPEINSNDLYNEIIKESQKYPLRRSIIFTNKSTKRKLHKICSNYVEEFNLILNTERQKLNHRAIRQILKNDKMYPTLCEIANDAEEFCKIFELDIKDGFKHYCNIGLSKIGKNYALQKFKTYKDYIFQLYERRLVVENDSNVKLTNEIVYYYLNKCEIIDEAQMVEIYSNFSHDFVYTRELIEHYNTTVENWINAQFEGMEYLDIIPEPYQLHTDEAIKRYLSKGKITKTDWREQARKKLKK